jgi:hypothetical protein
MSSGYGGRLTSGFDDDWFDDEDDFEYSSDDSFGFPDRDMAGYGSRGFTSKYGSRGRGPAVVEYEYEEVEIMNPVQYRRY